MQEDLLQLVHHLNKDDDNDDLFVAAQDEILVDDLDALMPQKRARGKQNPAHHPGIFKFMSPNRQPRQ